MAHEPLAPDASLAPPPWFAAAMIKLVDTIESRQAAMEKSLSDKMASLSDDMKTLENKLDTNEKRTKRRLDDLDEDIASLRHVMRRHGTGSTVDNRVDLTPGYAYQNGISGFRIET
jgi:hypothetical protein